MQPVTKRVSAPPDADCAAAEEVCVRTPARLHFGLLRFAQTDGPSFGGLGLMIDAPALEVVARPAAVWDCRGPAAAAVLDAARRAWGTLNEPPLTAVRLHVSGEVARHCGLGSGTQLALAAAAAIVRLAGRPLPSPEWLAAVTGRGQRSAIGAHGFCRGGLLWERGRLPHSPLAQLADRVEPPPSWRVVAAMPQGVEGISGARERAAFQSLPPVPPATSRRLEQLAEHGVLPAARRGDLATFGEALYEYGRLAGQCFQAIQGGPFADAPTARRVAALRRHGVAGAGQSSWGPTVFGVVGSPDDAAALAADLQDDPDFAETRIWISPPSRSGAQVLVDGRPCEAPAATAASR
jgi:beta-RFAP synthase